MKPVERWGAGKEVERWICTCVKDVGLNAFNAASFAIWRHHHNSALTRVDLSESEIQRIVSTAMKDIVRFREWCRQMTRRRIADTAILKSNAGKQLYLSTDGLLEILMDKLDQAMDFDRTRQLRRDPEARPRPKQRKVR